MYQPLPAVRHRVAVGVASPLRIGSSGLMLLLGCVAAVTTVLVFMSSRWIDDERECTLAADVASAVGGGPFYRNLEGEMIGEHTEDKPMGQAHCADIFRARGLAVLPPSALLFNPTRLGTRLMRPYFLDGDHATIDLESYGGQGGAERISVERRGSHWRILRRGTPRHWPPTL